ncbi:FUSC family protein [uncultured Robinsoniella sp.]|uniref:FUSC family protein n=1 Tax=uncultured Robinsoniella sp. TaxID=904190 RepID=UPI00374F8332
MFSAMKNNIFLFRKKWDTALPVILFFLFLFYSVIFLFGTQYSIIVSFLTTAFQIRRQKKFSVRGICGLVLEMMLLCILAFFATINIPLCLLLNFVVPFLLVYLQTTQFNQKGYFTYAMAFVFLQLVPTGWSGILPLMGVMLYSLTFLAVALALYSFLNRRPQDYRAARKGMDLLARQFRLIARGSQDVGMQKEILDIQSSLHKLAYDGRQLAFEMEGESKLHYMFALLFQRSAYFISNFDEECGQYREEYEDILCCLADYVDKVHSSFNKDDNEALIQEASNLLNDAGGNQADNFFYIFFRNFLHLLVLILDNASRNEKPAFGKARKHPKRLPVLQKYRQKMHLDAFEVRFALRLSIVIMVSFLISRLTNINHAYWIPLNAFLMIQPMYEDSAYRVKNRLIGTFLGCMLVFFTVSYLPGNMWHFIFATVMVALMYCTTPGTRIQAVFSTSFALFMASITMNRTTAVELRIFYLVLAVFLVLLVNRFFFPTSLKGQFRGNVRELFRIQKSYLSILDISTHRGIDYGVVSEALTHFYLVADQVKQYLSRPVEAINVDFYRRMLDIMWKMSAEAEQMIFIVQSGEIDETKSLVLHAYIKQLQISFQKLQHIDRRNHEKSVSSSVYSIEEIPDFPLDEAYLTHLMMKYVENAKRLFQLQEAHPDAVRYYGHGK